jgi:hypothetical protein
MWRAVLLSMFMLLAVWAGPKRRVWQDAEVIRVENSTVETEELSVSPGTEGGAMPPNGVVTRRTTIWIYTLKTSQHVYRAKFTRKPPERVVEGDRVRFFVDGEHLSVLTPGGKERRAKLLRDR